MAFVAPDENWFRNILMRTVKTMNFKVGASLENELSLNEIKQEPPNSISRIAFVAPDENWFRNIFMRTVKTVNFKVGASLENELSLNEIKQESPNSISRIQLWPLLHRTKIDSVTSLCAP